MNLWRNYDLTKAVMWLRDHGWRLKGYALVGRRFGVLFVWKEQR